MLFVYTENMTPQWIETAKNSVEFLAALVVAIAGAVGFVITVYKLWTGGFGFLKTFGKINKFVDRVDVLVDDFWPEVLGGLERKGLVSTGATARWTSAQAKILKSASPIQITDVGRVIITDIGFEQIYTENSIRILALVREKLGTKRSVTDFDIEQASLQAIGDLFNTDDPITANAKNYTFNHPQTPLSQLQALIGIFIRDKIITDATQRSSFGLPALTS